MSTRIAALRAGVAAAPFLVPALGYLAAVALAEGLTTYADARLGMVTHYFILVRLLLHSYQAREDEGRRAFLISLIFAPLIRILSLALPLTGFPGVYWYLIISVPLFLSLWMAGRSLGLSWRAMGLTLRGWPVQGLVALSGVAFGVVEYLILRPAPLVPELSWDVVWGPALVLLVCTGLLEEMIFRGLMQWTGRAVLGRWALLYVTALFGVLHLGYKSVIDVLFVLAVGFFFGWVVQCTGSLLGVTLAHGLTNIVLFLVMPFVPLGSFNVPVRVQGPAIAAPLPALEAESPFERLVEDFQHADHGDEEEAQPKREDCDVERAAQGAQCGVVGCCGDFLRDEQAEERQDRQQTQSCRDTDRCRGYCRGGNG